MTDTTWKIGFSGNWGDAFNWTTGVPDVGEAVINTPGTYTITVSDAEGADDVLFDNAGATLNETVAGQLDISGIFDILAGKVILNHINTIGSGVFQTGGILETSVASALGSQTYSFHGGEFVGLANETITNEMTMSDPTIEFAAVNGTTLTLNAPAGSTLDATDPSSLTFGSSSLGGTVFWNSDITYTNPSGLSVVVAGGTLTSASIALADLLGGDGSTTVNAGAAIDLNGFELAVSVLSGAGKVINSGALTALESFGGGVFSGSIQGDIKLEDEASLDTLTGTNTYIGGTSIGNGDTLQLGTGGTKGTIVGDIVDNGTLIYDHSGSTTQTAGISGTGDVTYEGSGTVAINRSETYNGLTTIKGHVTTANAGAFGTFALTVAQGGSLLATATANLSLAQIDLDGGTISAAHGKTLTLQATSGFGFTLPGLASGKITFGQTGDDGTIVIANSGGAESDSSIVTADIKAGMLKAGDDHALSYQLNDIGQTLVEAGATLNWNGFAGQINDLAGAGSVINSGGASIDVFAGDFSGIISGNTQLNIDGGVILTGANTYSAGTDIDSDGTLSLGDGHTTGSVVGDITDDGALLFNRSNTFTETALVSGTGMLRQFGTGTTVINRAETYSGGTVVTGGVLSIGNVGALGSGDITVQGGELLGTQNITPINHFTLGPNSVFAAATGKTFGVGSTGFLLTAPPASTITFGDSAHKGTVVLYAGEGAYHKLGYGVEISDGTLKAGDDKLGTFLSNGDENTIDAGATLDIAGFTTQMFSIDGSGSIIDSGAAALLQIDGGGFGGKISGAITVEAQASISLSGGGGFTGGLNIDAGVTVTLAQTVTPAVTFAASGMLVLNNASGVAASVSVTGSAGGGDTINGGAGNDAFNMGKSLVASDVINGGAGTDTLGLTGNYSAFTFGATTMVGIEKLKLHGAFDYNLTTNDANVASGKTLSVDASGLNATHTLTFDGSHETNGSFHITGGAGNDAITGGAQNDILDGGKGADRMIGGKGSDIYIVDNAGDVVTEASGGGTDTVKTSLASYTLGANVENLTHTGSSHFTGTGNSSANTITGGAHGNTLKGAGGADHLIGGAGNDTFVYAGASDSTGVRYDQITGFNASHDRFNVTGTISGISAAITSGKLSTATFDANLASAVNASHLHAHHAVEFTASSGTLKGDHFLIVDLNGTAGYQAGHDLVIELSGATNLNHLTTSDFV